MVSEVQHHWLNRKRFVLYVGAFALVYLILAAGILVQSSLLDPKGFPLGFDFRVFWSAAQLAAQGHPEAAYDLSRLHVVVHAFNPEVREGSYGWFYPPHYFLLITPLAWFPYNSAYLLFMMVGLVAYGVVIRAICPRPETLWVLLGFSGLWINLLTGQNGFLTAAAGGGVLLLLESRPLLSGVMIGLLSCKPQLALLFPVALLARGAWKPLIAAVCSAVFLMLISVALLGMETFRAWQGSLGLAKTFLEVGGTRFWMRMPTFFSFTHLSGASILQSYGIHALVGIVVMGLTWLTWRRCRNPDLRYAQLTAGTLLISPYVLIYDLTWLALPIAWMAKAGLEYGWKRGEREVLALAWLLPAFMMAMSHLYPLQLGGWCVLALFAMISYRAWHAEPT